MLHLAQVQTNDPGGKTTLRLLAQQKSEYIWTVLTEPESISLTEAIDYGVGVLLVVEISNARQIASITEATGWVLELIEAYLSSGMTPTLLEQEAQRAEQWRQSLTLQSQELARRALEMEARRDQIQDLEENLKQEKQQLEIIAAESEARCAQIQEMEENLQREKERLRDKEETLKRERKQIDLLAAELKAKTNSSAN